MKSPIITIALCALVGVFSYYAGAHNIHNEQVAAAEKARFTNDFQRISIYYTTLQKIDSGEYEESAQQLNSWLTTDLAQISSYMNQLPEIDKARINSIRTKVSQHREQNPKAYYTEDDMLNGDHENQAISMLVSAANIH
ncbi:hypothetical protein ACFL2V_07555 [Pseudomonadota bacterium]